MSVKIGNNNMITMTRGDTLRVQVGITVDGTEYVPEQGDSLRFAVKHPTLKEDKSDYTDTEPLILKGIPPDTLLLELAPEDTKALGFGKYDYDIEITFADGAVDTFIEGQLVLTKEVH